MGQIWTIHFIFDRIFFNLTGNKDRHKILDELDIYGEKKSVLMTCLSCYYDVMY